MRVWLTALFFALVLWQPAQAQQLLTPREFGDAAVATIQQVRPDATVERQDDLGLLVRAGAGENAVEHTMNFESAYREYQGNPAALTEILQRWARLATQPPEHSQVRERIVSVLRPRAMIDQVQAQSAAIRQSNGYPPSELVWRPFAGDLVEVVAFDGAETIQYALVASLADIDVSPDVAWTIAPGNLPARLGELEIAHVEGSEHLVYVTGGNGLAPSTLANRAFCSTEGGGSFVFLLVDRNGYLMADRSRPAALAEFRQLYQQIMRDGDAMSSTPLACQNGEMRAFALTD